MAAVSQRLTDSKILAKHNGTEIENTVLNMLGLKKKNTRGAPVDFIHNGRAFEIKSCQVNITDVSCATKTRHGRFLIEEHQHEYLRATNGTYIFVVHEEREINYIKIVRAREVYLDNFPAQLCWLNVFRPPSPKQVYQGKEQSWPMGDEWEFDGKSLSIYTKTHVHRGNGNIVVYTGVMSSGSRRKELTIGWRIKWDD